MNSGRHIFEMDWDGDHKKGDTLEVFGFPFGLPFKAAQDGVLSDSDDTKIFARIPAFHGNSGSMVLNQRTKKIAGILTAGRSSIDEFYYDRAGDCMRFTRLAANDSNALDIIDRAEVMIKKAPFFVQEVLKAKTPTPLDRISAPGRINTKQIYKVDVLAVSGEPKPIFKNVNHPRGKAAKPSEKESDGEEENGLVHLDYIYPSNLKKDNTSSAPAFIELQILEETMYPQGTREFDVKEAELDIDVEFFAKIIVTTDESGKYKGKVFYLPYSELMDILYPDKE